MKNTSARTPGGDRPGRSRRVEWRRVSKSRRVLSVEALEGKALMSGLSPLGGDSEAVAPSSVATGTFTSLTNPTPAGANSNTMLLGTDGSVLMFGANYSIGGAANTLYKLSPDANGSYVNGTWSQLASMALQRYYYGSNILPDGRLFVQGGEYSGPSGSQNTTNKGEIYNPATNSWSAVGAFPQSSFGDDPTELLANGNVLGGYLFGPQTYQYSPSLNSWSATGTKLRNDQSDEEAWVKLPDGSILSYDIFSSPNTGAGHAQRYIPSSGTWVDAGTVPVPLSGSGNGSELGPGFLLPDGRVVYIGANGNTAFYTESSNSWTQGPSIPNGYGMDDAPGAELTDGKILLIADTPLFHGPSHMYLFDPTQATQAAAFTDLTASVAPTGFSLGGASYGDRMLVLPTGQVLINNGGSQLVAYTPAADAAASTPTITTVGQNADTSFTLTGTALNGISEGAAYGDDAEMASNYPIINFTDSSGKTFYGKTFGWTSQVATGATPVTTNFSLPANLPVNSYSVRVIANGSASAPLLETNPTTVNAASASPNPDGGVTASLSVLGNDALGESSLGYTWATTTKPNGAPSPTFSVNGTNGAKNDTVTFFQAGSYTFTVTFKNAVGLTTTSSVTEVVSQTVTTLAISPKTITLAQGGTQQFSATATDQFGAAFTPTTTFSVVAGGAGGTISASGLYTAPASGSGTDIVMIAAGSSIDSATVTVTQAPIITLQPISQTVTTGQTVTLTAAASGNPAPTVVWYVSTDGVNFSPAPGNNTSTTYSFTAQKSQSGNLYEAIFTNTAGMTTTQAVGLTVLNPQALVTGTSVTWGTAGTSTLQTAADGLRLLPSGRTTDLPWLGINKIAIALDQPGTLTAADVTVTGINVASYGPVTISGSGASYTITLAQPITAADRVTVTISDPSITTFTRRLDVLPGDVNDDGAVNIQDAIIERNGYLGFASVPVPLIFLDILGDGSPDLANYNIIRKLIGTKLP